MTHPSYKENYGTNADHARNALSHCGIRQIEFGDKRVHTAENRKRGINMLISIMSKFGKDKETESKVKHFTFQRSAAFEYGFFSACIPSKMAQKKL